MLSFFESKNLLRHIEGTAVKPPGPVIHPKGTALTEEQEVLQCKVFTLLSSFSLITIELEPDILYIKGALNDSCDGL